MAVGVNQGGNLNVFVFEVGMLHRDPLTGEESVTTVAIHPLLTAPTTVRYSDRSRTQVMQTAGGSIKTTGGRALRNVSLDGTFGVEARGFGPFIGSGELRFNRFRREIVRLGDALFREDVDEVLRILSTTVGVREALERFDEETTQFFLNFYDFWNQESFECNIPSFDFTRQYRNGGASGLVMYQMQIREVGPIVGGGIGEQAISGLFLGLVVWTNLNAVLTSFNTQTVLDAQAAIPELTATQLGSTITAVTAQLDAATGLMSGQIRNPSGQETTAFFGRVNDLIESINEIVGLFRGRTTGQLDNDPGQVSWSQLVKEGDNAELARQDEVDDLLTLEDATRYQQVAGVLFGMDVDAYREFIASSGAKGVLAPDLIGSIIYTIRDTDTGASIEAILGVAWEKILELNGFTPDEALVPGTRLEIPRRRQRGSQSIDGLPVFGSHVGKAAWGIDFPLELKADSDGKPILVFDEPILEQGALFLSEAFGDAILQQNQDVLEVVQTPFLEEQLRQLFLSDRRFLSLDDVAIAQTGVGLDVQIVLTAINGGSIRTGGSP